MPELISRKHAIESGLKYYFTGQACLHGHISKRDLHTNCYECNKSYARARSQRWRDNNPELMRLKSKENYKKARQINPEKKRTKDRVAAAKRRSGTGKFTFDDIQEILKLQKRRCAYCRKKLGKKYHLDHVIPIKLGGSNYRNNIQVTCIRCNLKKNAKDPIMFSQSLGLLL